MLVLTALPASPARPKPVEWCSVSRAAACAEELLRGVGVLTVRFFSAVTPPERGGTGASLRCEVRWEERSCRRRESSGALGRLLTVETLAGAEATPVSSPQEILGVRSSPRSLDGQPTSFGAGFSPAPGHTCSSEV